MAIIRLKEVLAEKGVSNKLLAEKVGVTPATISYINNGNQFPKEDLLLKIAKVLDVDVRELFMSTKTAKAKSIFIEENGKYKKIGEISPEWLDEGSVPGSHQKKEL